MPFRRRRRRRLPRLIPLLALLGVGLWLTGFVRFAETVPDRVEQPGQYTDAIIVLTGGSKRLSTGLALLTDGMAEKLFVSGVYRGVDLAELLDLAQQDPEELQCCIALGYAADNTVGNAAETAAWISAQGYRSLRLVTAAYHMPRSLLEFRHALPDTVVIPHPVFPPNVMQDEWWRWPGTTALLATEYTKYLGARLRILLGL